MLKIIYEAVKKNEQQIQQSFGRTSNHFVISSLISDLNKSPNKIRVIIGKKILYVKTYLKVEIPNLIHPDPYKNPTMQISLITVRNEIEHLWIFMKQSTIPDSGFGVFAGRKFQKNDFITAYLGVKFVEEIGSLTYACCDITVSQERGLGEGMLEEYWLAHRIQHKSGIAANVQLKSNKSKYSIFSKRKIEPGEELFMDYNRNIICSNCHEEKAYDSNSDNEDGCNICKRKGYGKQCESCGLFLCQHHYDREQYTF